MTKPDKRARKQRAETAADDIATSRRASWEASGARDNGGRRTPRASTIPNKKREAARRACRGRHDV